MVVHRSIQLFDTRFMVRCLETSSGRKAWVKDGWTNVLSATQAETTRGAEHSQQSAPPPRHNTPTALCEQYTHVFFISGRTQTYISIHPCVCCLYVLQCVRSEIKCEAIAFEVLIRGSFATPPESNPSRYQTLNSNVIGTITEIEVL